MYVDIDNIIGFDTTDIYHAQDINGERIHLTHFGKKLIAEHINSLFD